MDAPLADARVLTVRFLDLGEEEAAELRRCLAACPGVRYVLIDALSGLGEVEYVDPCGEDEVLAILRSTGKPVLTDFACC